MKFNKIISFLKESINQNLYRLIYSIDYLNNIYIDKSDLYEKRKDKKYLELYRLVERGVETIQSSYIIEYIRYE